MKKCIRWLIIVLVFVWISSGFAEKFVYPGDDPLFSITFPDDWQVDLEKDLLHASPPDESLYFGLWAVEDIDNLEDAGEAVGELISELVSDFKIEEEGEMEINNIPFLYFDGSGTDRAGDSVHASVALFTPDGDTFCVLLYFGSPEAEETYQKALEDIVSSIENE